MRPVILMVALASFCLVALSSNFNNLKQNTSALLTIAAESVEPSMLDKTEKAGMQPEKPIASTEVLAPQKVKISSPPENDTSVDVTYHVLNLSEPTASDNALPSAEKVDGKQVLMASQNLDQQLNNISQLLKASKN